ncbi:putative xanthine dehydrogenase subunit A [compost metagenome]|uniref:XdhC family protein n=1 Tax=Pseudomonas synxantha TaxID=47883 RepID=A0A5D3GBT8_9PSED|nr:XdhC family protein [Pseudomonas synxantha]TYK57873.1 XdhC family protein [Pseudomonas synxantha]
MDSVDLNVLKNVLQWRRDNFQVWLYTVVQTWGSAPRPPGAMLALREDGMVIGSVSGGCIEDDLITRRRVERAQEVLHVPLQLITYGLSREEAARFGLPCGGTLRLIEERITDSSWVEELLTRCENHEIVCRELSLSTGHTKLSTATRDDLLEFDGKQLKTVYGPRWRLLLIGAGQLSRYVASMARMLDFDVLICDPREEFAYGWEDEESRFVSGMPDDAVQAIVPDAHTAIVALTHDPRLDDMALLTALKSNAFYIGALGSRINTLKRRENLALLGMSESEIARLHGPVGLHIGSHTPPEIALSLMAEIVSIKNGVESAQ